MAHRVRSTDAGQDRSPQVPQSNQVNRLCHPSRTTLTRPSRRPGWSLGTADRGWDLGNLVSARLDTVYFHVVLNRWKILSQWYALSVKKINWGKWSAFNNANHHLFFIDSKTNKSQSNTNPFVRWTDLFTLYITDTLISYGSPHQERLRKQHVVSISLNFYSCKPNWGATVLLFTTTITLLWLFCF